MDTTRFAAVVALALTLVPGGSAAQQCSKVRPARLAAVASAAATLDLIAIAVLHDEWWDTPRTDFHVIWGRSPSKGQDALLHAFVAYQTAQVGTAALRWACLSPTASAWVAGIAALTLQLPKEIGDGFHNGFSGTDLLWVGIGAALAVARRTWQPAAALSAKAAYWPSDEYRAESLGRISIPTDYAGQRYFLAVHPGAIDGRGWPAWLGVAVGHGVPAWITAPPRRQWYLALDLQFQSLPIRAPWWQDVARVLDQIHIPLPGLRLEVEGVRAGLF